MNNITSPGLAELGLSHPLPRGTVLEIDGDHRNALEENAGTVLEIESHEYVSKSNGEYEEKESVLVYHYTIRENGVDRSGVSEYYWIADYILRDKYPWAVKDVPGEEIEA